MDTEEVSSGAADPDVHLSVADVMKLRSSILRVIWSRRESLANVGAVLSLLDDPQECDPAYCVVRLRFRMVRRYLVYRPCDVRRVYRFLEKVREWSPGHGPIHLLVASATGIGFQRNPHMPGWVRPGLPGLSTIAGPIQHQKSAILDAWRDKVSADLCAREGFRYSTSGCFWYLAAPELFSCSGER